MQEIIIDEEFRFLLPTLDEETFRLLEESLLEYGCRDPLVLTKGLSVVASKLEPVSTPAQLYGKYGSLMQLSANLQAALTQRLAR